MFKLISCSALVAAAFLAPGIARAQNAPRSDTSATQTYYDFQVDQLVKYKAGPPPTYPSELRSARIEGEVLVQFVVDERGVAVMNTINVIKSTNDRFEEAVRSAIRATLFYPAELQGRRVRQLVQQPYKFTMRS